MLMEILWVHRFFCAAYTDVFHVLITVFGDSRHISLLRLTHWLFLLISFQKKLPLTTLAQCMVEGAAVLGDDSLLGWVLQNLSQHFYKKPQWVETVITSLIKRVSPSDAGRCWSSAARRRRNWLRSSSHSNSPSRRTWLNHCVTWQR